jgi:hypothetical protein
VPIWCVAPLEMNEGNSLEGKGTISLQAAVPKKHHTRHLTHQVRVCVGPKYSPAVAENRRALAHVGNRSTDRHGVFLVTIPATLPQLADLGILT